MLRISLNERTEMLRQICARRAGTGLVVAVAAWTTSIGAASGQSVDTVLPSPSIDRWMYNFNQSPGSETGAPVFSPFGYTGPEGENAWDDHDGQFLIGFDTGGIVPTGRPLNNYRVLGVTATVRNTRYQTFRYDNSYDAWPTFIAPSDPAYVADADVGRPVEMYVTGYRNGFTPTTFRHDVTFDGGLPVIGTVSPFSGPGFNPGFPFTLPQRQTRNVYPAQYNPDGSIRDISNNIDERFDPRPVAIGVAVPTPEQELGTASSPIAAPNTAVNPGDLVPAWTDFAFTVDVSNPDAIRGIREGLAAGRVNFIITSLQSTFQQGANPPRFVTRVGANGDPRARPARLSIRVCVGAPADWNCDGSTSVQDIFDFLTGWFANAGDFNADGATTVQDLFDYLAAYFS